MGTDRVTESLRWCSQTGPTIPLVCALSKHIMSGRATGTSGFIAAQRAVPLGAVVLGFGLASYAAWKAEYAQKKPQKANPQKEEIATMLRNEQAMKAVNAAA